MILIEHRQTDMQFYLAHVKWHIYKNILFALRFETESSVKIVSEQNILLKKTLHLYKMVNSQIWFIKTHIKKSANTHRENVLKRKAEQEMLFQNSQHEQHFSCVHSEDQGISDSRCQRFEADKKWMWYEWPRQGVLCGWGIKLSQAVKIWLKD